MNYYDTIMKDKSPERIVERLANALELGDPALFLKAISQQAENIRAWMEENKKRPEVPIHERGIYQLKKPVFQGVKKELFTIRKIDGQYYSIDLTGPAIGLRGKLSEEDARHLVANKAEYLGTSDRLTLSGEIVEPELEEQ